MKECLLAVSKDVCGITKGPPRHRESWWWNEECAEVVKEKKRFYGVMQKSKGGVDVLKAEEDREEYNRVKRKANKLIAKAKEGERKKWGESLDREDGKGKVFRVVKQMVRRNRDVVGGDA